MAFIDNLDRAVIDEAKITHYLLSREHPRGRTKAIFFERFGFSVDQWVLLREAFIDHARQHEVSNVTSTPFGEACEIVGPLSSPDGRNPNVLVVWMFRNGEGYPRLVTAYPAEGNAT